VIKERMRQKKRKNGPGKGGQKKKGLSIWGQNRDLGGEKIAEFQYSRILRKKKDCGAVAGGLEGRGIHPPGDWWGKIEGAVAGLTEREGKVSCRKCGAWARVGNGRRGRHALSWNWGVADNVMNGFYYKGRITKTKWTNIGDPGEASRNHPTKRDGITYRLIFQEKGEKSRARKRRRGKEKTGERLRSFSLVVWGT